MFSLLVRRNASKKYLSVTSDTQYSAVTSIDSGDSQSLKEHEHEHGRKRQSIECRNAQDSDGARIFPTCSESFCALIRKILYSPDAGWLPCQTIAERDDEIRRLKKALRRAELKGTFPDEYEYYFEDDDDSDAEVKDEEDDELDDESSNEAPAAIFDREDDVFRCVSCTFEVVGEVVIPKYYLPHSDSIVPSRQIDGFCQSCATMHQYYVSPPIPSIYKSISQASI